MRAGESWNTGTASALFRISDILKRSEAKWTLILRGDHIYRMDYAALLKFHRHKSGIATVAYTDAEIQDTQGLATLTIGDNQKVTAISKDALHPTDPVGEERNVLISMDVFVISMKTLLECLESDHRNEHSNHDFCDDIIPVLINQQRTYAYRFGEPEGRVSIDKYWCNIATLDEFYEANMALLKATPPIDLYQDNWLIRTYTGQHPPARTVPGSSGTEGICINSIVANGVIIAGGSAQHSILFAGVYLADEAIVQNSLLFQGVHIGEGAQIKNAIVDKFVKIPAGETIGYDLNKDRERFTVTAKGIVIVPQDYSFSRRPG